MSAMVEDAGIDPPRRERGGEGSFPSISGSIASRRAPCEIFTATC
jgi:hypothetical protein